MRFSRSGRANARRRFSRPDELACRDAVKLMTDYLDGALSARDSQRLSAHLAGCPDCTEFLRQLRITASLAGHIDPVPDEATTQSLAALYRQWRAESD